MTLQKLEALRGNHTASFDLSQAGHMKEPLCQRWEAKRKNNQAAGLGCQYSLNPCTQ